MSRGTLLIISSPSGAGKSTVVQTVMASKFMSLYFSVSHTTRGPRPEEVDGKHYHFVTREEFLALREAGGFLEWAEVYTNLYGTSRMEVESRLEAGIDVLLDIDVQGAHQVREKMPEALTVFLYPPSRQELERRLRSRGTESDESLRRRLATAGREMAQAKNYGYAIINEDVEEAAEELRAVFLSQRALKSRRLGKIEEILESFDL